jgi:hypothetical protein
MAGVHRPAPCGRRAAGQVLPAAIFVLLAGCAFLYWTVNSGQMVVEKMRLTNAADAAAYSAGIVQARALNYDAYINRAVVANEIAVAQVISVASWSDYFSNVFCNISALAEGVGSIGAPDDPRRHGDLLAFTAADAVATYYTGGQACTELEDALDVANPILGAVVSGFSVVSQGIAASQQLMHAGMSAPVLSEAERAAQRATDATGPHMLAELLPESAELPRFVRAYAGDDRERLMEVVHGSRDPFTADRNWTLRDLSDPLARRRIERRGGTLMTDPDRWVAGDSMNFRYRTLTWRGWRDRDELIGSGDVTVGHGGEATSRSNRREFDFSTAAYQGLPTVYEISDTSTPSTARGPTFGVSILVTKQIANTLTSGGAAQAKPSGRLAAFDAPGAPAQIAALSRAEVLFERPPRADGRTEYASLYSPFWHVRLVPPTEADRSWVASRQDGRSLR